MMWYAHLLGLHFHPVLAKSDPGCAGWWCRQAQAAPGHPNSVVLCVVFWSSKREEKKGNKKKRNNGFPEYR
jgi:hypothetical protein